MGEKEAIEILKSKGMTQVEAEDFVAGVKRGVKAMKKGDRVHWDDVKKELGIGQQKEGIVEMEAKCYECAKLYMEEGDVPPNWVTGRYYTCSEGRYSMELTHKRWFAWSGIVKPNKTVRAAQTNCPFFQQK